MISNHPSSFVFRPPIITTFFFILVLIIQFQDCLCQQQTDDDSKKYENCKNNFTCRDGINIGYPFYGNNRPDYCGFPGYRLECNDDDKFTEIEIISQKYRVLQINQAERIMNITRRDFIVDDDACPENFTNTILNTTMFSTPENGYLNLTLYYDCLSSGGLPTANKFNCKRNKTLSGDAYFWSKTPGDGVNPNCRENMEVPISITDYGRLVSDPRHQLLPILREGFDVTYYVDGEARTGIDACVNCIESGGACGYGSTSSSTFSCFCVNGTVATTSCPDGRPGSKRKIAIGVGIGVVGSLLIGILVVIFLYYRQRRKNSSSLKSFRNISSVSSMTPDTENGLFPTPIFTYKELEEATNCFDDSKELGDGGFGTVYYGELKDGRAVAVKRLYENNYKRVEQFMNEVTILSSLRHPNLVILYGCTSRHSRELLLVYEFVSNGTVADHLHGERAGAGLVSWPVRMSIAIESAGALAYLHASDIIHRDVKTNNILLDDNFHVKVADFGLSRLFPTGFTHVSTAPQGTPGYVDPEYYQCYQVTDKSDVYSFGVVLIELISSKQAVDISRHRHEINLANLAISKIHNHELDELVDPSLGFQSDFSVKRMITLVAELAYRCLQQESDTRPSMAEVLEALKAIESEGSKLVNAVEMDIPVDDVGLLKNSPPYSPDSVTQEWDSNPSTLNSST